MEAERPRYWFPASNGVRMPWQGWAVHFTFDALMVAGIVMWPPLDQPLPFVVYMAVLVAALAGIWRWKGEPREETRGRK